MQRIILSHSKLQLIEYYYVKLRHRHAERRTIGVGRRGIHCLLERIACISDSPYVPEDAPYVPGNIDTVARSILGYLAANMQCIICARKALTRARSHILRTPDTL